VPSRGRIESTDVLVIGCGIAGATAALRLSKKRSLRITVLSAATEAEQTNTLWAQGGIAFLGAQDSPESLADDILRSGDGLSDPEAVAILCRDGPPLVQRILVDDLGAPFDQDPSGGFDFALEAAHSTPRILHVGDTTGRATEERLVGALGRCPNIELSTGHTALELLTPSVVFGPAASAERPGPCVGAHVLDQRRGEVITYLAKKTVLATGGLGWIYLHTTNPPGARGDGVGMAHRAGAEVANAEYVQFHPTVLRIEGAPGFLISEALRGEGAVLVNASGQPFMEKYDSEWGDLAPRDVVSRSINREMMASGAPCVYLDLCSHMAAGKIKKRFPNIHRQCLKYGVDITRKPIPVAPGAHYLCGGVRVDGFGRTTVRDLYAVGEVACTGVHGANRLAGTSLLEGLVWGYRAAEHILDTVDTLSNVEWSHMPFREHGGREDQAQRGSITQAMVTLRRIMWERVALVRSTNGLRRARADLEGLRARVEELYRSARLTDSLVGVRNAVEAALIVTTAAWENRESRGCHFRED
jgi:L-aspartate oxidase